MAEADPGGERRRAAVHWLETRRRDGRPRDPAVARALLERCGAPLPPAVLHVVGTNGKGTVTHLLAAMATAAGLRTGRFTSPHVEDLSERIAVDAERLTDEELVAFVARVRPWGLEGVGFFEWTLALAVDVFARRGVELAVVEAGVGARFDATTALPNVVGTVLTNVDLDHLETLGPTLLDVARDKAAVARPGVPLVCGAQGEAGALVAEIAAAVGAPLDRVDPAHPLARWPDGAPAADRGWPPTRRENAALALALGRRLGWSEAALAEGLRSAPPPARFERFLVPAAGQTVEVVLDGAHDPAAAARLADAVPVGYQLVYGSLVRKRSLDTLTPLRARAAGVWLTRADADEAPPPPPGALRGGPPGAPDGGAPVAVVDDVAEALGAACAAAAASGGIVVVAGSLHLAGRARPWLREHDVAAANRGAMLTGRWDASGSSA